MALLAAIQEPPIPEKYFHKGKAAASVKCHINGGPLYRERVLEVLDSFGICGQKIYSVWKGERSSEVCVTFHHSDTARVVALKHTVEFRDKTYYFTGYLQQVINVKVHWVPDVVDNEFLKEYFSRFGTVTSVTSLKDTINGFQVCNGKRSVVIETKEKDRIPHMVKFGDAMPMLVTAPGRLPICFGCLKLGHKRIDCPGKVVPGGQKEVVCARQVPLPDPPDSVSDPADPPPPVRPNLPLPKETPCREESSEGEESEDEGSDVGQSVGEGTERGGEDVAISECATQDSDVTMANMKVPRERYSSGESPPRRKKKFASTKAPYNGTPTSAVAPNVIGNVENTSDREGRAFARLTEDMENPSGNTRIKLVDMTSNREVFMTYRDYEVIYDESSETRVETDKNRAIYTDKNTGYKTVVTTDQFKVIGSPHHEIYYEVQ